MGNMTIPSMAWAYCIEDPRKIENFEKAEADNFKGWVVHHRFELKCPVYKPKAKELIEWNLYFHRPASELIYMKQSEHNTLHNKGRKLSAETRYKMHLAQSKIDHSYRKGKPGPNRGKQFSEEWRRKISEAGKGRTPWNKGKSSGYKWFNNGFENKFAIECPEGYVAGRLM